MVSRSASSSGDQLKSTYCLSQFRVSFIANQFVALPDRCCYLKLFAKVLKEEAVQRVSKNLVGSLDWKIEM
jgi:hypothetical protein